MSLISQVSIQQSADTQNIPNLERFEQAVKQRHYRTACDELICILTQIDSQFGGIQGIQFSFPTQLSAPELKDELYNYFATRMATSISQLFMDKKFVVPKEKVLLLFQYQRWISMLFACSPYLNADHVLRSYDQHPESCDLSNIRLSGKLDELIKFCIMYLPESNAVMSLDALWQVNQTLCASLCFSLQSSRFIGTEEAFSKRGAILQWFPEKLAQFNNLDALPTAIAHDVYMHCSYDIAENKHNVKKAINQVIRRHLLNIGWQDRECNQIGLHQGKPVMVVMLEHFNSAHSIYRTHSTSMIAARERFYLIAFGSKKVDQVGREVFDEFYELTGNTIIEQLNRVKAVCEQYQAAVLYMPSIGMQLNTIFASNTRLAPIQAVALGHPGTTHSEFIDYVVVEDDYVGSENCFSETLLRLPKDALPYVPSSLAPTKVEYCLRESPEVVQIGIASTTMKLNPHFLMALRSIAERSKVKVHFHFALGQSLGLTHPYVSRFIKRYLGDMATAHAHAPYIEYLEILRGCDMMLNPFPFGNTNGIIDMVTLGLVGVCKTGAEVHEHIDEGLFKRLGLPEWLIADTAEEYVTQALRLIENHQERLDLRRHIIENNGLQILFTGDPTPMGCVFEEKVQQWAEERGQQIPVVVDKPRRATKTKVQTKTKSESKVEKAKVASKTKSKPEAKSKTQAKTTKSTTTKTETTRSKTVKAKNVQ